jgi:hypothetical protein
VTGNRELAARARGLADQAPAGSLERKAALSAAILLDETRTVAAARKLLGEIVNDVMRQAAGELLGQPTTQPTDSPEERR